MHADKEPEPLNLGLPVVYFPRANAFLAHTQLCSGYKISKEFVGQAINLCGPKLDLERRGEAPILAQVVKNFQLFSKLLM